MAYFKSSQKLNRYMILDAIGEEIEIIEVMM